MALVLSIYLGLKLKLGNQGFLHIEMLKPAFGQQSTNWSQKVPLSQSSKQGDLDPTLHTLPEYRLNPLETISSQIFHTSSSFSITRNISSGSTRVSTRNIKSGSTRISTSNISSGSTMQGQYQEQGRLVGLKDFPIGRMALVIKSSEVSGSLCYSNQPPRYILVSNYQPSLQKKILENLLLKAAYKDEEFKSYKYMYIRMDYHIKQLPLHCRIAPPPIFSHEPYPPLASQNSSTVLNELKCVVERVAASSPVCPCCSEDSTLVPTGIRSAPNAIVILLKDVLVQCAECHRDVKAGCYEEHECTPSLTLVEEREAAALLKRAISTSPDQGIIQLPTGGTISDVTKARHPTSAACSRTVKTRCSEMQTARSIVSGGEPSDLMEKEVLTLSDEERKSLLQKAGITNVAIDSTQVLAIKAGLAIPWNKMRLLRR
eukprot:Em0001g2007a